MTAHLSVDREAAQLSVGLLDERSAHIRQTELWPVIGRGHAIMLAPMSTFADIEKAVANLTRDERAQLLQSIAQGLGDSVPGIETRSDVCGGDACIVRTRIPVWVLEQARRLGQSDRDLLDIFPTLRAGDLTMAWAYVRSHSDEIDREIRENEAA